MKYLLLCMLSYIFMIATCFANCPPEAPVLDAPTIQKLYKEGREFGPFYMLKKDSKFFWLYGTVHVNTPERSIPGPEVLKALAASNTLMLEIDPLDPSNKDGLVSTLKYDQSIVIEHIPLYQELSRRLCVDKLSNKEPFPITLNKLFFKSLASTGYFSDYGSDIILASIARKYSKRVIGIESFDQQNSASGFQMFKGKDVSSYLRQIESGRFNSYAIMLNDAWSKGDLDSVLKLALRSNVDLEAMSARNVEIKRRIDSSYHQVPVFLAVGVFHLVGDGGLLSLFERDGYEVLRVN